MDTLDADSQNVEDARFRGSIARQADIDGSNSYTPGSSDFADPSSYEQLLAFEFQFGQRVSFIKSYDPRFDDNRRLGRSGNRKIAFGQYVCKRSRTYQPAIVNEHKKVRQPFDFGNVVAYIQ